MKLSLESELISSSYFLSDVEPIMLHTVVFFFMADRCHLTFFSYSFRRMDGLWLYSALKLLKWTDCLRSWLLRLF